MKRFFPLLLLAAAAGAAVYFYPQWFHPAAQESEIKLSGNIEAHESEVSFKVSGRVVDLPVEEGQTLKAGQLIARLDSDDYRQQVAIDEAALQVRDRQLQLALAGNRHQDIEAARQSVEDARADLAQKQQDFERFDALYKRDEISAQTRDQALTNVTRAKATLVRLEQMYNMMLEGTRKEEIAVDRASTVQASQNLGMSRIRLSYTTLTAPFDGVILVRQAELGEIATMGTPVVTLADLDHIWVRVYLPETDLGRVRWGQDVAVRTDTFPGKTYRGKISFISSEAEFTPKSVQTEKERVTLVYRLKVDVENPNHELKPGMPADVFIPRK
ncbi:MAG TPA: HlyD family efflux transporter periplasmic adaptor subunit [Candidatus Binatia bacterium]|nr:HlyD family efflux transporter periplasmic adaptor subunit [Candidatus Binatia bacterium]